MLIFFFFFFRFSVLTNQTNLEVYSSKTTTVQTIKCCPSTMEKTTENNWSSTRTKKTQLLSTKPNKERNLFPITITLKTTTPNKKINFIKNFFLTKFKNKTFLPILLIFPLLLPKSLPLLQSFLPVLLSITLGKILLKSQFFSFPL